MPAKRRWFNAENERAQGWATSGWAKSPPPANVYAYGGSWPVVRKQALERDQYRCRIRFPVICIDKATEVDHIIQPEAGGGSDLANLRAVCVRCHARRTGRQGALAKQRAAQRRNPR